MQLNLTMPAGLKVHYKNELDRYQHELSNQNMQMAWHHLERAHILGQPWFTPHTQIHWLMFRFGIRIKSRKEILGQLPRLLLGGVKSFVGIIPIGNTGGANVPPLRRMKIPEDLSIMLAPYAKL